MIIDAPITRPTRVADMLLAGRYRYIDFPGAEPQLVDVSWELGLPIARFCDVDDEDAGLELDPRDMDGEFQGPNR